MSLNKKNRRITKNKRLRIEELLEEQLFHNAPIEKPKCRNLSIEELLSPQPFYKQPIKKLKRKKNIE